ncbi:EmrB/QacA subfamily drug resistance transporter [Rhodococcus sp. 27YEA15]|uniref:DHA2 family efflux MFS transporter permease subunit n=1 Tax=Rhodococcus sp. 27YEA15 TaxID=3156259 RepID=UPI003C7B1AA1
MPENVSGVVVDADESKERTSATPLKVWLGLATSLVAAFMQLLDATIVNVALPSIAVDLDAGVSAQLLMVSVYILAFACSLITAARVGDRFGRRRVFLIALSGFVLASLLCGLAQDAGMLVLFRALQGLAAGSMSAQTFAMISGLFPKSKHPKVFGIYGATIGLATISGPLAGGLLIEWDVFEWGWRLIFFVNVPIGILALVLGYRYLVDARAEHIRSLDLVGAGLSAIALFLLIFPLAEGRARGWPGELITMMVLSVPVAAAFVAYELRLQRRGGEPVVTLALFRDRAFSVGAALAFVFFGTLTSLIFTISLTLQFGFGFSALRAGVVTVPWAVGMGIAALSSSTVYERIGNRVLILGMVVFAGSLLALSAILGAEGSDPRWAVLAGPLFVGGIGLGLFVAPLQTVILAGVDPARAGSASGLLPTVQQVGSSIGLAVVGIVFFGLVAGQAPAAVQAERANVVAQLERIGLPENLRGIAADTFVDCARSQLESSTPMATAPQCRPAGASTSAAGPIGDTVEIAYNSTRAAAGAAFSAAQRRVLVIIAVVALAVALASTALPRTTTIR